MVAICSAFSAAGARGNFLGLCALPNNLQDARSGNNTGIAAPGGAATCRAHRLHPVHTGIRIPHRQVCNPLAACVCWWAQCMCTLPCCRTHAGSHVMHTQARRLAAALTLVLTNYRLCRRAFL